MDKTTKLGIFMDHATANLISFPADNSTDKTIHCSFTHEAKEEALQRGESIMHTKEQGEKADYYRKLADTIRNYDEVLLFGPTEAKTELYDTFKHNHLFTGTKLEIMQADKMTANQQRAFVKEFFKDEED
ncbi:hypothetical protein [Pedobacter sp. ASV28]|uniref:hypothetical protein n=1 Tax=Pedobacter sp. ASV28 TaxID=2795123 RepID=UPI0018ED6620|nr:hypothetical protein [Pedobacter sp. ASV28]